MSTAGRNSYGRQRSDPELTTSPKSAGSVGSRVGTRRPLNVHDDELGIGGSLLDLLKPEVFAPGQTIFTSGWPGDRVYVVRSGVAKVMRLDDDRRAHLVALAGPNDILGELAVFDPGPRTSTVTALDEVRAGWLDRATLRRWIAEHPDAGMLLLQLLSRQLKRKHDRFAEQHVRDPAVRTVRQLAALCERFGVSSATGGLVLPALSSTEFAQLVGSPENEVTTILQQFAARGWIRLDGTAIEVRDRTEWTSPIGSPAG